MRQIVDEKGRKRFDTRVHIYDSKGKLVKKQPYRLEISSKGSIFTDVNTGKKYLANGDPFVEPKEEAKKEAK